MGLGRRKKEDTSKYYYVVYSWEIKGKGCGTGACTITVTAPGDFLISSVAKDISEKLSRGSVIILNWREITKKQSEEFVGAPEADERDEPAGDKTPLIVKCAIGMALAKKFGEDDHKISGWLETPRPEWLMMDANELIRIGDASRVLEFLEKDE